MSVLLVDPSKDQSHGLYERQNRVFSSLIYLEPVKGGAADLKVGGQNHCERSEQKMFRLTPTFGIVGYTN